MTNMKAPHGCNAREQEYHLLDVPDHINAIGYTPDGWLNEYTLMCGYQEYLEVYKTSFRLYSEHGATHVIIFDDSRDWPEARIWETFDDLNKAREFYATNVGRVRAENGALQPAQ
mgnify:FL=1